MLSGHTWREATYIGQHKSRMFSSLWKSLLGRASLWRGTRGRLIMVEQGGGLDRKAREDSVLIWALQSSVRLSLDHSKRQYPRMLMCITKLTRRSDVTVSYCAYGVDFGVRLLDLHASYLPEHFSGSWCPTLKHRDNDISVRLSGKWLCVCV